MAEERSPHPAVTDPWADSLGIRVAEAGEGYPVLEMTLDDRHMNFLDGAHGGALFSLAEAAVRYAARQDSSPAGVLDSHLVLTAGAAEGDRFTAVVESVRVGRTLGVYRAVVERSDGRVVGEMTATVRLSR